MNQYATTTAMAPAQHLKGTEHSDHHQEQASRSETPLESNPSAEQAERPSPSPPTVTSTPPTSPSPPASTEDDKDGQTSAIEEMVAAPAGSGSPPSKAEIMVALAKGYADLFHTPDGDAFASIMVNNHHENVKIRSQDSRQWLGRLYYKETGKPVSGPAIKDALEVLEAEAKYDGPQIDTHLRYAWHEESIYVDLVNETWDQVQITRKGWTIIGSKDSPVKFYRAQGMAPLSIPIRGVTIDPLRSFLNIESESDWVMLVSWLVGSMKPSGPFAVLVLQGEQGTAKSTTARFLRDLIDPSAVPSQSLPRSERDLVIAASKSWVLNFDNLSYLSPMMSDAFCRLATGGGFRTRALYTDDSERLFNSIRPMIMNGISDIATRHDLADRSLIVQLPVIPKAKRVPEKELMRRWESNKRGLFGALCNALAVALANEASVRLPTLPRMADFATWATAGETAFGWEPGTFMREYENNQKALVEIALEADPVAVAVIRLIHRHRAHEYHGTASDLMILLNLNQDLASLKNWPKTPNKLSGRLKRAAASLREIGLNVEWTKSGDRMIHIVPTPAFKLDTEAPEHKSTAPVEDSGNPGEEAVALPDELYDDDTPVR